MGIEQAIMRSPLRGARVLRTGMGPARSRRAARALAREPGHALLIIGFCGGLDERSRPGEVIVAEQVHAAADESDAPDAVVCAMAPEMEAEMIQAGLDARTGTIACVSKIALGERRAQLHAEGAIAVDMESVWLAAGAGERRFVVVRVVLDAPRHELFRPKAAAGAVRAGRALRQAARVALVAMAGEGLR
jgi:4-hydroxy-3-methylbut-2-enyl diphosphate reductase